MNLTQLKVYIKGFADGLREGQAPKAEQWQELLKVVEAAQDDLPDVGTPATPLPVQIPAPQPFTEPYYGNGGGITWEQREQRLQNEGTAPCDVEPYYGEVNDKFGQR